MCVNQENPTLKRLEEQIDWYVKKSAFNQSRFKGIKIIELVAAALIPLLAGLSINFSEGYKNGDQFHLLSRKDEDFVLKLATNLKRQGIAVWLAQWDISLWS